MASQLEACRRLGCCRWSQRPAPRRPADQVPRPVILLREVEREAGMRICATCTAGGVGAVRGVAVLARAVLPWCRTNHICKIYKRARTLCGSMLCVYYWACSLYWEGLVIWVHSFAAILCMFNFLLSPVGGRMVPHLRADSRG